MIWMDLALIKHITITCSCPDKSESLGFPLIGMKFDDVTQWVIAYGRVGHIPLLRKSHLTKV